MDIQVKHVVQPPTKRALRKLFIKQRMAISDEDYQKANRQILDNFTSYFKLSALQTLHLYLPIPHKKEIDTFLLIKQIRKYHPKLQIVVPKSNFQTFEMQHFLLEPHTPIEVNALGIPEPSKGARIMPNAIDMIIVPLLAFDLKGYRVGYGKGFYDRFLSQCRPDAIKVGLSFFPPIPEITDIEPTDIALDYCVLDNQVIKISI